MAVNGTVLHPNRRSEGQSYYLSPGADTLIRKRSEVQVLSGPQFRGVPGKSSSFWGAKQGARR
jgi:hypothetical protein